MAEEFKQALDVCEAYSSGYRAGLEAAAKQADDEALRWTHGTPCRVVATRIRAPASAQGAKIRADDVTRDRPSCKLAESCEGTGWRECETDEDHVCGSGEPCFGCDDCEGE